MSLLGFISENTMAGGMQQEVAEKIEALWNEYKENSLKKNCSIITGDFGKLGSVVIRKISTFEPMNFKYESGSYDYVSIKCDTTRILWTDYQDIEPYNRSGDLYCDGASFEMLGKPIKEVEDYREFNATSNYKSNISFAVWGFDFNDFYGSVRFGMCIKNDKVDEFMNKLRTIINKLR